MGLDSEVKYQYLAGICVNIITISYGGFCGWISPSLFELKRDDSPLETGPISNDDAGWVSSMLCVGGTLGTVFFAWCADKIGRKRCLLCMALPSLASWLIIPFARTPMHLCISRILGGFAGGGAFTVIPIYITELANDRVRGTLGTLIVLSFNFGILCGLSLGYYFTYDTTAWIMSLTSLAFLLFFPFLPETPQHLMNNNKEQKAEMSLRYFRNIRSMSKELPDHIKIELEKLKNTQSDKAQLEDDSNIITWKDFSNRVACKAFLISMGLLTLLNGCGCFAMLNYSANIFQQSGSSISPNVAAIIVGFIQLVGSYVATFLVDRAGRKPLLIISSVGIGIGHACFGSYSYLTALGYDTTSYAWVPVVSFSFTIFISCWGVISLPYLVMSEIMPPKIRNISSMICMVYMFMMGFFMLKNLPMMSETLGMHGMVLVFGSCSFAGAIFIGIYLPETKGKGIEEILSLL